LFSQADHAYIVQATSPAEDRWKEWRKECVAGLFTMKYFTENEAKALRWVIIASVKEFYIYLTYYSYSTILNIDVNGFLGHFKKWGPNVHTCIGLSRGSLTERELRWKVSSVATKFAQDPTAITMQASSQDFSHVLFTITPNDGDRSVYNLRVITPYLCGLVMEKVAELDMAYCSITRQVPFHSSNHFSNMYPPRNMGIYIQEILSCLAYSTEPAEVTTAALEH